MSRATVSYFFLQAGEWALEGCLYCYSSVFLLSCGLSNTFIGILLGIAVMLSFLGQIFLGEFFNLHGQASLRKFFLAGGLFLILSNFLLFLGLPNWLAILLFMLCCLLLQIFPAFLNSAAMVEIQSGVPLNYGVGRGGGSLGYALCASFMGSLILSRGVSAMFLCGLFLSVLFIISAVCFFYICARQRTCSPAKPSGKSAGAGAQFHPGFLKKYRRYSIILLGTVILMAGHTYMSNFIYQVVSSKGGNEASVGIASAIAACCEFPVLFLFGRMKGKLRCDSWFKLSCLLLTLKMGLTLLAPTLPLIYLSEVLQMGYALFMVSSVYYTGTLIPREDTISSQSYLNAASTLGVLISLLSGGVLIDSLGIPALLTAGLLLLSCGTLIIFLSAQKTEEKPQR
ncbi:MAG: hypothetical protein Q4C50_09990 [Eubacteriales bacterium]|nr:hypothetical protein [Eubacteriales bacterium]